MTDTAKPEGRGQTAGTSASSTGSPGPLRVLTVGDPPRDVVTQVADGAPVFLQIHEINANALAILKPDIVLSPLVTDQFDCFDVAVALVDAQFNGMFRAVVDYVPDPALVRREIAARCPGLDFDVITLGVAGPGAPG